jgi:hypothetical protein
MALAYGNKEVLRFACDYQARKVVVELRESVLDEGAVISYRQETLVYRGDQFDAALEEFLPLASRERIATAAGVKMDEIKQETIQAAKTEEPK